MKLTKELLLYMMKEGVEEEYIPVQYDGGLTVVRRSDDVKMKKKLYKQIKKFIENANTN